MNMQKYKCCFTLDCSFLRRFSFQLSKNIFLSVCALHILVKSNLNHSCFIQTIISLNENDILVTDFINNHFLDISSTIKAEIFAAELFIKRDSKNDKGI